MPVFLITTLRRQLLTQMIISVLEDFLDVWFYFGDVKASNIQPLNEFHCPIRSNSDIDVELKDTCMVHIKDRITVANISPIIIPREVTQKCLHPWPYPLFGDHTTECLKKTSFSENWAWQILLLIMRNPPSFSLANTCDSFCSPWYPSSCGTPSQERIAEAD